jgi:hypothetical protein
VQLPAVHEWTSSRVFLAKRKCASLWQA